MRTQRFTGYPKGQRKPSCQAAGPPHILLWGYPQKASPYFSWKPSRWKVATMGLPSLAKSSPCPKTALAQSLSAHVNVSFSINSPFLKIKKLPRRVLWEPCLFDFIPLIDQSWKTCVTRLILSSRQFHQLWLFDLTWGYSTSQPPFCAMCEGSIRICTFRVTPQACPPKGNTSTRSKCSLFRMKNWAWVRNKTTNIKTRTR